MLCWCEIVVSGYGISQSIDIPSVPSAPRSLKVELVSPTEVKLSWDPPLHENGLLRGYYVYKVSHFFNLTGI